MKVVSFYELVALPTGTVFCDYEPCITQGLYRLDGVIRGDDGDVIDFFYLDLAPCLSSILNDGDDDRHPRDLHIDVRGSRWGLFDYDALFIVYEAEDVATLVRLLRGADLKEKEAEALRASAAESWRNQLYDRDGLWEFLRGPNSNLNFSSPRLLASLLRLHGDGDRLVLLRRLAAADDVPLYDEVVRLLHAHGVATE